jgi:hypothetical protein
MTKSIRRLGILLTLLFSLCPLVGCEDEVMEAETPSGEVEVEEEVGGGLEAEVED